MTDTSRYGIRLPAPKLGLPKHLQTHDAILDTVDGYIAELARDKTPDFVYVANARVKHDLIALNRFWRIERSRADHLEEMVESLQREVADLRGKNGWFRRIFPRRSKNG